MRLLRTHGKNIEADDSGTVSLVLKVYNIFRRHGFVITQANTRRDSLVSKAIVRRVFEEMLFFSQLISNVMKRIHIKYCENILYVR